MATDVLARVAELRTLEDTVRARRATAQANLDLAQSRLASVEAEIRALGFEPDTAEASQATLEAQLNKACDELTALLQAELASCDEITKVTAEALK